MDVANKKKSSPREFIDVGDYTGALSFVKHKIRSHSGPPDAEEIVRLRMWQGYLCYCQGKSAEALETYQSLLGLGGDIPSIANSNDLLTLYSACCNYRMKKFEETKEMMKDRVYPATTDSGRLANRLLFFVGHCMSDEPALMKHHQGLSDTAEDQLALAAMHMLRNHVQEADDIYKMIVQDSGSQYPLANLLQSCSKYTLDYYDVVLELLKDEAVCVVVAALRTACNYSLYNAAAGLEEFTAFKASRKENVLKYPVQRHNHTVLDPSVPDKMKASILSEQLENIPVARFNLAVILLKQKKYEAAYDLFKSIEPSSPQEYSMKGIICCYMFTVTGDEDLSKEARQFFQVIGASATECDTIPGRLCMAYCFFLHAQYDDSLIYLKSIAPYMVSDQAFQYTHGLALFLAGRWKEGMELFSALNEADIIQSQEYLRWMMRCHVRTDKPADGWKICEELLKLEGVQQKEILLQFADDCYAGKHYYHSVLAFVKLRSMFPEESLSGLRGAVVGALKRFVDGEASKGDADAAIELARKDSSCDDICELYVDYVSKLKT